MSGRRTRDSISIFILAKYSSEHSTSSTFSTDVPGVIRESFQLIALTKSNRYVLLSRWHSFHGRLSSSMSNPKFFAVDNARCFTTDLPFPFDSHGKITRSTSTLLASVFTQEGNAELVEELFHVLIVF